MKKCLFISLIVGCCMVETEATALPLVVTDHTEVMAKTTELQLFGKRRKGYRKKRGFLWGLFRKKDCGCPKH